MAERVVYESSMDRALLPCGISLYQEDQNLIKENDV